MACRSNLIGYLYSNRIYSWLFFFFSSSSSWAASYPLFKKDRVWKASHYGPPRFFSQHIEYREQRFLFLFWAVSNHASPLKCIGYNEDRELEQKKAPFHSFRSRISRGERKLSYWVLYCTSIASVPINCRDRRCLRWEIQWKTIERESWGPRLLDSVNFIANDLQWYVSSIEYNSYIARKEGRIFFGFWDPFFRK